MSPMGRPKIPNPKAKQITVRLDNETFQKLEESAKRLGKTKVEVLRMGIEKVFSEIEK